MGILRELFGKTPAEAPAADALLDGIDDENQETVAVSDLSVESSAKQVCRYIFQQMVAGRSPAQLQTDLARSCVSTEDGASGWNAVVRKSLSSRNLRIISRTKSSPQIISVTGCSTCKRVFISMK